jgi:hypothetical protein
VAAGRTGRAHAPHACEKGALRRLYVCGRHNGPEASGYYKQARNQARLSERAREGERRGSRDFATHMGHVWG